MISTTLKRSAAGVTGAATIALTNFQFALAVATPKGGSSATSSPCAGTDSGSATQGALCAAPASGANIDIGTLFQSISNILIFLVGAISVIVLIIGGLRYVISAGNATQITGAKNTILYAIVGIVISLAAYAIVHFIFGQIGVTS